MNPFQNPLQQTRRHFFGRAASGIGTAALASLLSPQLFAAEKGADESKTVPGILDKPHFKPRAKRVIYLFMSGAPSQIDMWDYKPKLNDMFDKDLPESVINGQRFTTMTSGQKRFPIAPSMFKFSQHGQNGLYISELLPHTAKMVDDLCVMKTIHTEAINHDPAITYIQTGSQVPGRPSMGSWLSYGLGSANKDLPAFVVLHATWTGRKSAQALYTRLWGSGFLPSKAWLCVPKATLCSIFPTRPAYRTTPAVPCSTPSRNSTKSSTSKFSILKSTTASPNMKWPIGCRLRSPN